MGAKSALEKDLFYRAQASWRFHTAKVIRDRVEPVASPAMSAMPRILLQKSKVASVRIFSEARQPSEGQPVGALLGMPEQRPEA
jgi:hypothetical protein